MAVGNLSVIVRDEPGENPRSASSYVSARAFTTVEAIAIPSGAKIVRLAGTVDFYFSFTGTAAVPADVDDGTASELVKQQSNAEWFIIPPDATAISLVAGSACVVTASFYTN